MFPTINLRETGVNLHRIMDKRGITPNDIKEFLNLGTVQSVYNWCNGLNMPTIDNLYALSQLLQVPMDEIICGNRKAIIPEPIVISENSRDRRLYTYCRKLNKILAA
ncbi:MAG: helix-turn-helix transcriptional regulator [Clostridiales bacterium]|nr:helix-turn-helix transcriptional regulator [Clostridiales bacterium]